MSTRNPAQAEASWMIEPKPEAVGQARRRAVTEAAAWCPDGLPDEYWAMTELETGRGRLVSRHRTMAEEAASALMAALKLADLPPLVSLSPALATGYEHAGHVQIGGANARTVLAIAQYIAEHAECHGRVIPGELLALKRELEA